LAPKTIKLYSKDLFKLSGFFIDPKTTGIVRQDIRDYIAGLVDTNLPITRARKLSCFKSFFRFLTRENIINANPTDGIEMPKLPQKEPNFLSEGEYKQLIEAVKRYATPFYKERDLSIIYLFLGAGLRVSELIGIKINDINFKDQLIKIHRKGNKEQVMPINSLVSTFLKKYSTNRPKVNYDSFFISRKGRPLQANSVYHLVKKYLLLADIHKDKMGCHILRHTFCTQLLNRGVNLIAIQELAGHKNLETTRKYLHINSIDLRNAVNQISL
jgi:integrase/recombinase XerC